MTKSQVTCAAAVDEAEQAVRADLSALVAARSDAILAVQVRGAGGSGSHPLPPSVVAHC